jgi:hypothetical protein
VNLHTSDGTKTIGGRRSAHNRGQLEVMPSELGKYCSTPGCHRRCKWLVPSTTAGVFRPARNWCEYLGEGVTFDERRPVRIGECIEDFGEVKSENAS